MRAGFVTVARPDGRIPLLRCPARPILITGTGYPILLFRVVGVFAGADINTLPTGNMDVTGVMCPHCSCQNEAEYNHQQQDNRQTPFSAHPRPPQELTSILIL